MRKSRKKSWRHVYFYDCTGGCGKRRATFDHDRFLAKLCTRCQEDGPNDAQPGLFSLSTEAA